MLTVVINDAIFSYLKNHTSVKVLDIEIQKPNVSSYRPFNRECWQCGRVLDQPLKMVGVIIHQDGQDVTAWFCGHECAIKYLEQVSDPE